MVEQVAHKNILNSNFSNGFLDIDSLNKDDVSKIDDLIHKYPYCQILYMMAARTALNSEDQDQKIALAAVTVPERNILYKVIHHPEIFKSSLEEIPELVELDTVVEPIEKELISIIDEETEPEIESKVESFDHEDEVFEEIAPLEVPEINNVLETNAGVFVENLLIQQKDDDSLEINSDYIPSPTSITIEKEETIDFSFINIDEEIVDDNKEAEHKEIFEPLIENIELENEEQFEAEGLELSETKGALEQVSFVKETESSNLPAFTQPDFITKYNDERLPYTFLWWLAKTRKQHQLNIRPYAVATSDKTDEVKKNNKDSLDHQIIENIFHLRSVDDLTPVNSSQTVSFDFIKKEHQIIEKFIKEEPQIKPPPADKIDTENKARKSSEDNNELVSETLAKVYVEQMLFHKALDVYKKLSLKYPEKSTYFASQIKYLELKVN
jgi:hypothetical protein